MCLIMSWWLRLHWGYNIRYTVYINTSFSIQNLKNWTQIHFTQGLQIKPCDSVLTFRLFSSVPIKDIIFDHVKCKQGTVGSHRVCFMASCAEQGGSKGRSSGGAGKGGPGKCRVSGRLRGWGMGSEVLLRPPFPEGAWLWDLRSYTGWRGDEKHSCALVARGPWPEAHV